LPKQWWSYDCFFFPASEALQKGSNFCTLTLKYAKKTRHWVRLVWNNCPVSTKNTEWVLPILDIGQTLEPTISACS